MKRINYYLGFIIAIILFAGCTTTYYYQVYDVKLLHENMNINNEGNIVYEDDNCKILYNFWTEGGSTTFAFCNKSSKNMYIDLGESFYVSNGVAYDYYKNRTFSKGSVTTNTSNYSNTYLNGEANGNVRTNASSYGSNVYVNTIAQAFIKQNTYNYGVSESTTSSSSVSRTENRIICIPPKTMKYVSGYSINPFIYKSCSLRQYPTRRDIKKGKNVNVFLTENGTPLIFGNIIAYSFEKDCKDLTVLHNDFFVNKIVNYRDQDFHEEMSEKDTCGYDKDDYIIRNNRYSSHYYYKEGIYKPNGFYIKYRYEYEYE